MAEHQYRVTLENKAEFSFPTDEELRELIDFGLSYGFDVKVGPISVSVSAVSEMEIEPKELPDDFPFIH